MLAARVLGIAGAGKTTDALAVIEKVRQAGFSLYQIAFVTLTRAARREASSRAGDVFGVKMDDLERHGWFRTVHSIAYKLLDLNKESNVITDTKESKEWLAEKLGGEVEMGDASDDGWSEQFKGHSPQGIALRLWDLSRGLMAPYEEVFESCRERGGLPAKNPLDLSEAIDYVERYESGKEEDDRLDFTDMLLQVIGYQASIQGCEKISVGVEPPDIPVWVIDEAQDNSLLMDLVIQHLTQRALWVYLYGDIWQAIYGFAGASADHLLRWPVGDKERPLLKSWRCAANILDYGKAILGNCSGWGSREWEKAPWEPRCEGGLVAERDLNDWTEAVKADRRTLVMSRTNRQASAIGKELTNAGIPWKYFKNNGGLVRPTVARVMRMMDEFKKTDIVRVSDWLAFLGEIPSGTVKGKDDLIRRGFKAGKQLKADGESSGGIIHRLALPDFGVQPLLLDKINDGSWVELVDDGARASEAVIQYGLELVEEPQVLVATIHGCKGAQADDVFMHTAIPYPVERALAEDDNAMDDEARLFYVAATRAREELYVVGGDVARFEPAHECVP